MTVLPNLFNKGLYFDKSIMRAINLASLKDCIEPMHEPFRHLVFAKGVHEELELIDVDKAILIKIKLLQRFYKHLTVKMSQHVENRLA